MSTTMSLEVNFHGPIAFRICKDAVWAYLPKCTDHYCNILTDLNDISPDRHKIYNVRGPKAADATQIKGEQFVPPLPWKWKDGPLPKKCYCVFNLPLPDIIFGLAPEYVEISGSDINVAGAYARGVRFSYAQCGAKPTIVPADGSEPGDLANLDAKYYNHSDLYQIEIRYHDLKHTLADPHDHHKDARKCSLSMRKLFPPCDKWKVSFDDPNARVISGSKPVDCGANPLVFKDGVTI